MKLLIRWFIIAVSLFVAAWIVPGIRVQGDAWVAYGVMSAILGLINSYLRPLLQFLSCSLILLTMGLFLLVINAFTLLLASRIAVSWFHIGFYVDGFWSAFFGAFIVSVVSLILSGLVKDKEKAEA